MELQNSNDGLFLSYNQLFSESTDQFLRSFEHIEIDEINKGLELSFKIHKRLRNRKISPILRLAKPKDAKNLVKIYKELYDGTYPYKEMENEQEVRKMIEDPAVQWVVFKNPSDKIVGCITFMLDFKNKKGYIRGFMLRKKYQGSIDIVKAMIGSMIVMCTMFKKIIFIWYVENRTAHAKSQFSMNVCGIAPIAFFPNKDVFLNKVESDLMQIIYDKKVLTRYRRKDCPKLIPEILDCFLFSNKRYNLGHFKSYSPELNLDPALLVEIKKNLTIRVLVDKFGYQKIIFTIKNSNCYFKFLYTPQIQNFEKTRYKVNNLEELFVFVQEFKKCGRKCDIRYCEAFISAYEPEHQKIFLDIGLSPRGYVPSWKYNRDLGLFEDHILFNYFEGTINQNIQLIKEGKKLLKWLKLDI
ncbi:MAG: GNAT family N-acetyltransferase [Promethearchaeota archaeon]